MAEESTSGLRVVGEGFDPWQLVVEKVEAEGDDYSPDEFYTKATNKHDHSSAPYSVRVDPSMSAQISALIQSGKIPHYRTPSDFFRDAITHRLHYLVNRMDLGTPELMELLARTRTQARLDMMAAEVADLDKMIKTARDGINDARIRGDKYMLDQLRVSLEAQVGMLREPYKGEVVGMISTLKAGG